MRIPLEVLGGIFVEMQSGGDGYKIDYSAVAAKSRCVARIGPIA
jgi:hypothetical protein